MFGAKFHQSLRKSRVDFLLGKFDETKEYLNAEYKTLSNIKHEVYRDLEIISYHKPVRQRNGEAMPFLLIYRGKSGKPVSEYYYSNEERRQDTINEYKERADRFAKEKADKKEAQKNMTNPFKVDDILYSSWGYDQTNVDFYQVVRVLAKSIEVAKIGSKRANPNSDSWAVLADPSHKSEDVKLYRVHPGHASITIASYANAYKWDGSPMHETSPYEGH